MEYGGACVHPMLGRPMRAAIGGGQAVIYDLLFRASAETMVTIAADPKHLGASIGITAVLHTWGSAMTHHPHVHMIGKRSAIPVLRDLRAKG
jgi:hypothetical protein